MCKEKRVKREYEAIGLVPRKFGECLAFGRLVPFQRMDTGATVWVRISDIPFIGTGRTASLFRFNGTLACEYGGQAVSGEYNGDTQKAKLVTWFEL